jgi:hypothetical protein
MAYLQVSLLGGSRDKTWRGQGIRECSVSWNLPKLSQLWWCDGVSDHVPHRTTYRQNSSWVVYESPVEWLPACCETNRQPLYWNFMYHSRIVLSVGGSVWYVVWNLRHTITTDSVLANSKTQNSLIPRPCHVSSQLPSSGETCKYATVPSTQKNLERFSTYWYAPLWRDHPCYCTAEVGYPRGIYVLPYTCFTVHKNAQIFGLVEDGRRLTNAGV